MCEHDIECVVWVALIAVSAVGVCYVVSTYYGAVSRSWCGNCTDEQLREMVVVSRDVRTVFLNAGEGVVLKVGYLVNPVWVNITSSAEVIIYVGNHKFVVRNLTYGCIKETTLTISSLEDAAVVNVEVRVLAISPFDYPKDAERLFRLYPGLTLDECG